MNQTGMEAPALMVKPQPTPFPDLPLSGVQTGIGTCPMLSGGGMTGMQATGSYPMQGVEDFPFFDLNPWRLTGWLMLFVVAWFFIVVSVMGLTWWVKRSRRSQPVSAGS